ncbi:MAG TPA: VOC family protein [Saprospiraceae bacterium]|mgnify:CR=1 FL=1|nr:VOC family protein [Saprospiraceae bacterium]HMQ84025.1 VOC family protein [Saprospiraceae bacterium]
MKHAISWFEIPSNDLERAAAFYGAIYNTALPIEDMGGFKMAQLPSADGGIGGAICHGEWYKPTADGAIVYLNGGDDLNEVLSKVENAGGQVLMPKKLITEEIGYMALFSDTEGNRVALYSPK